ncbi:hypothetical protein BGY98DRAFT_1176901 [Russula aff. rugulosa BPL654]|nr:hypothetical protein BGY98DRAFT_1176901 [Russula aff. rugulosa BPL654]
MFFCLWAFTMAFVFKDQRRWRRPSTTRQWAYLWWWTLVVLWYCFDGIPNAISGYSNSDFDDMVPSCQNKTLPAFGTVLKPHEKMKDGPLLHLHACKSQDTCPSVSQENYRSRLPPHIIILSDLEREKREAHPLSPPSVRQSRSPPHITILSNLKKEKREADLRSTQRTKSIRNTLATALALKLAPSISITPISILKAPTPPQAPAPAPVTDSNPDAVKENVKVKFVLFDIVVQETGQGVRDPETGRGADTTMMNSGEMLSIPLVDWRGRLDEDELSRYYPREHAKEQFVHRLRSMVRSGNRSAAARRRDRARRRGQTATGPAITTPPSIALIVSHTRP